ncbi:hypothetical protein ASPWEDRAFT_126752 [Aspergillus wentii DTO 134E9]|uniref:FAD-binding domain-containing protein n=1 Tax=Aspergillus wentii DTO 134E9 TaxID=1073089 RepID=A0A1L9RTS9_ASPWE|nr:uncharacterized protein ASPWEDRAFT_126752 [Aspergillus wentii DTO 134E9]OJJ38361.1 hypothetical protein ASPWEDRAFT_126752 [Aspergillus wentii DTO 134E9]
MKGLVVAKSPATADTPRAHGFNPFAFECLRDIGLEDAALEKATRGAGYQSLRWCRSMVGEEYGRVLGFGQHPLSMGLTASISPCEYVDLAQSQLEPVLVQYASQHGFPVRFSTELIGIDHVKTAGESEYVCTLRDSITHTTFTLRTRYLFGADGARSHVARSFDFKFINKPGGAKACNILFRADLDHLLGEECIAGLHWILKPDRQTFPGLVAHLRIVRPSKEWVLVGFGPDGTNPFDGLTAESPEIVDCIRELIGDDSVAIEVLRIDPWTVRESVAERYDAEHTGVFLVGDAAHRHPPAFGLGLNTCMQDAYNLAWKVAYVSKGLAGPTMLSTYNTERQPVGAVLVREANNGIRAHAKMWEAFGMFAGSRDEGAKQLAKLSEPTGAGNECRAKIRDALEAIEPEVRSLGVAYNQWYVSGAVFLEDESSDRPRLEGNPITAVQVSTYPGSRLPHAWLDLAKRRKMISTHDLAGKGAFCLLIGVGGDAWREAAGQIARATGIPINTYGIGVGLEYIDVHRDWYAKRGVEEDGCVLVRPDRFVAWRFASMVPDCTRKMMDVLDQILSRNELI